MTFYISIIGSGILSAITSLILSIVNLNKKIVIFEIGNKICNENSKVLNNAGTGHAGMCENNYIIKKNDIFFVKKNLRINLKFEITKLFLSWIKYYKFFNLTKVLTNTPHISYFYLNKNNKLINIFKKLKKFGNIKYTNNIINIKRIFPLVLIKKKVKKSFSITFFKNGFDINFELLTKKIFNYLSKNNFFFIYLNFNINKIIKKKNIYIIFFGKKKIIINNLFICSGGTVFDIIKKYNSNILKKYNYLPINGDWLISENNKIIKKHNLKVYSETIKNNPPMSIPHLDTRTIINKKKVLFGPYAKLTLKILVNKNYFYFLNIKNTFLFIIFTINNFNLLNYLIKETIKTKKKKIQNLLPFTKLKNFYYKKAGKRLQIIKKKKFEINLKFGTKLIYDKNKNLTALIGASPGASIASYISKKNCFYWKLNFNFLNYGFNKKTKIFNKKLHLKGIEPFTI